MHVRETGRTLKQHKTEHKQAVRNADSNNGLAVHVAGTGRTIHWDEAEVCREELATVSLIAGLEYGTVE